MNDCIFCKIVAGKEPAEQMYQDDRAIGIIPLAPVTDGHLLAVPRRHATDFTADWLATSDAMHAAFQMARRFGGPCNLITSKGPAATQSVFHLHVHVIPRYDGDGLMLPWSVGAS